MVRGVGTRALWEKVPFVMVSLVFMYLAILAREQSPFLVEHYDASEGMTQGCYATWFYIVKTVLPLNLIVLYPLPKELDWLAFPYSLSILATVAVSAGLFLAPALAGAVRGLALLPGDPGTNSGIIRNNSFVIAADRYCYLAMLGLVHAGGRGFLRALADVVAVASLAPPSGSSQLASQRSWF